MRNLRFTAIVGAFVLGVSSHGEAQQWPAASLVLRTNGAILRSGECVRLTLLATDDVVGPFAPSVSFAYTRNVRVEDEDGTPRFVSRRAINTRPTGPTLDRLTAGTSLVLDDAFCFGQGSLPGPYDITLDLTSPSLPSVQLTTCVEFQPDDVTDPSPGKCEFGLRGVVRRDVPGSVSLDATVGIGALYRLLVLRSDRLLRVVEGDLAVTRPNELSVEGDQLSGLDDAPVDLVLNDLVSNRYASASRVAVGRAPHN